MGTVIILHNSVRLTKLKIETTLIFCYLVKAICWTSQTEALLNNCWNRLLPTSTTENKGAAASHSLAFRSYRFLSDNASLAKPDCTFAIIHVRYMVLLLNCVLHTYFCSFSL